MRLPLAAFAVLLHVATLAQVPSIGMDSISNIVLTPGPGGSCLCGLTDLGGGVSALTAAVAQAQSNLTALNSSLSTSSAAALARNASLLAISASITTVGDAVTKLNATLEQVAAVQALFTTWPSGTTALTAAGGVFFSAQQTVVVGQSKGMWNVSNVSCTVGDTILVTWPTNSFDAVNVTAASDRSTLLAQSGAPTLGGNLSFPVTSEDTFIFESITKTYAFNVTATSIGVRALGFEPASLSLTP